MWEAQLVVEATSLAAVLGLQDFHHTVHPPMVDTVNPPMLNVVTPLEALAVHQGFRHSLQRQEAGHLYL